MTVERNATARALPRSSRGFLGVLFLLLVVVTPVAADPVDPFLRRDSASMLTSSLVSARPDRGAPVFLAATPAVRQPAVRRTKFVGGHLMPRMNRQFAGVQPQAHEAGPAMTVGVFRDDLSLEARRRARRGARRAVRAFLLDVTSLDRVSDSVRRSADQRTASRPSKALRFRAGVAHGLPKAEMRFRGQRTNLRVVLSAARVASIDLGAARHPGTRLSLKYDADDDRFRLACSHSF